LGQTIDFDFPQLYNRRSYKFEGIESVTSRRAVEYSANFLPIQDVAGGNASMVVRFRIGPNYRLQFSAV